MSVTGSLSSERSFQANLAFGQQAETEVAKWLMRRGYSILPVYDIEYDTGKGPRLFSQGSQIIAPDALVWRAGKCTWVECKRKTCFSWHRKSSSWVTGIDRCHWSHYQRIAAVTGIDVWILFLHGSSRPDHRDVMHGCPDSCPSGLFGQSLAILEGCINHVHANYGKSGMVYWRHASLVLLSSLDVIMHVPRGTCGDYDTG